MTALSALAALIAANLTLAAVEGAPPPIPAKIIVDEWTSDAGSRAAGAFCLPNGGYDRSDFEPLVPAVESSFGAVALPAGAQNRLPNAARADFHLLSVKMKLCAKKYGAWGSGQARAMTGSASYEARLKIRTASGAILAEKACAFTFAAYKKKAAPDGVIFSEGLRAAVQNCLESV